VGDLGGNVKDLRDAVQQTWRLMLRTDGEMPRIYFYTSGKNEEHIAYILEKSTDTAPPLLSPALAKVSWLPAALQQWTGGSPRLLVYSFRALHHLHASRNELFENAELAMDAVYKILKQVRAVASEVFLSEPDETEWRQTWLYLILLAQLRVPCHRETKLPVGDEEHSLELLLGRLNVYITPGPMNDTPDALYISHMQMIDKFVRDTYNSDCRWAVKPQESVLKTFWNGWWNNE
ncbi:unnamed protein product, partial [Effrenium voratum]